jgi:hypothetical protein
MLDVVRGAWLSRVDVQHYIDEHVLAVAPFVFVDAYDGAQQEIVDQNPIRHRYLVW